jgi:RNA polymerase sigma-70 factor (ECF subfamily)
MLVTDELDFKQVYDTYQPRILRYLIRLMGAEAGEDLTQEVFLKASQNLSKFRGEAQISTWLYRIASNAAIDKIRSASFRHSAQEVNLVDLEDVDLMNHNASEPWQGKVPATIEQIVLEKDRLHCFLNYIKKLPVNYKMVVMLSEVEALTIREIAEILGLSEETIKIRLHRGRARLFQALKENCKPEEWL